MEQKGYAPLETFFLTENSGNTPAGITSVNTDNLPVTQRGYLLVNEHHAKMAVFDASGKMVAATTADYNMRSLPAGVYLVRIAGVRGECKIIKQ